ncbi:MAG: PaaX family transcriptional regulator C-terminal domain-containing protein [Pseudomonadota bacterium]
MNQTVTQKMSAIPDEALASLIKDLQSDGSLRVWSLIVTFFGDAIVPRGGAVSAQTVQQVMARCGVESGAVRTAFFRLAADGWVEREKIGRNSHYRLSKLGHAPFRDATRRIYAPVSANSSDDAAQSAKLSIAIAPADCDLDQALDATHLAPRIVLYDGNHPNLDVLKKDGWLVLQTTAEDMPEWVLDQIMPPALRHGYERLISRFDLTPPADPLGAMALRTLLIHEWRRLLLRNPPLPKPFVTSESTELRCMQLVARQYRQLLAPSERWLDNEGIGPNGALPTAEGLDKRFS